MGYFSGRISTEKRLIQSARLSQTIFTDWRQISIEPTKLICWEYFKDFECPCQICNSNPAVQYRQVEKQSHTGMASGSAHRSKKKMLKCVFRPLHSVAPRSLMPLRSLKLLKSFSLSLHYNKYNTSRFGLLPSIPAKRFPNVWFSRNVSIEANDLRRGDVIEFKGKRYVMSFEIFMIRINVSIVDLPRL